MPFLGNLRAFCVIGTSLLVTLFGLGGPSHAGPPTRETDRDDSSESASKTDSSESASETDSSESASEAEPDAPPNVSTSTEIDTSLYVRSDSDHTTVVSPRIRFHQGFEHRGGETGLSLLYATDVWTSASVDIRTAASPRVTEQRDEIVVSIDHRKGPWELGLGYRLSTEPDFLANGLSLAFAWEGLARNVRLESRVTLEHDVVGRSGDPQFARPLRSLTSWFGYTQVLGRSTLMQFAVEQRSSHGYHASPYRWVGLGGPSNCSGGMTLCLPEIHPDRRARFALVGRLRQGLGKRVSVGLDYRYYADSWALQSHTLGGDLRIQAARSLLLAFEYRGYFQGRAWFYRPVYAYVPAGGFVTRDRELSTMLDHRATAALEWSHRGAHVAISSGLLLGAAIYRYREFLGLSQVFAVEGSWIGRLEF